MTTQITLPRDAEGREIPLDTKVLYDEKYKRCDVSAFEYWVQSGEWRVTSRSEYIHLRAKDLHLTPPDSWEKLEEDLDMAVKKVLNGSCISPCCAWFNNGVRSCVDCPADESPTGTCNTQLINDIAARIRKLRGED